MPRLDVSKYTALPPERLLAIIEPRLATLEESHVNIALDTASGDNPGQEERAAELWDELEHLRGEVTKLKAKARS